MAAKKFLPGHRHRLLPLLVGRFEQFRRNFPQKRGRVAGFEFAVFFARGAMAQGQVCMARVMAT
jgi:hypothetical protein